MGIKFLSFHLIPWCFQVGNHISCIHLPPPEPPAMAETIKLIKSDGLVKIYDRPVHVSELMLEFPKHMVCRSDSFYIGQKIPALSETDQLQLGHKYFLLPKHCFQSVLSFVTIASIAKSSAAMQLGQDSRQVFLKKVATCQPFDIQKTPSGCLRVRVSDDFISQLMEESKTKKEEDETKPTSKVCTTPQLQKDYTQLVGSRQWKPKLETIKETTEKRKISDFGIKRKKKQLSKMAEKSHKSLPEQHLHSTSTKISSKAKIKIKSRK